MKQTCLPTITTCATTNSTVAKPSHVPNSSFFHIPPYISLALVTSPLNKTSFVASTLTPFHLLHPRMQLLNTLLTLPFLFPKLSLLIHACAMSSSGLLSSVYTPFSLPSLPAHAGAAEPLAASRCPLIYSIEGAHFSTTSSQYDR